MLASRILTLRALAVLGLFACLVLTSAPARAGRELKLVFESATSEDGRLVEKALRAHELLPVLVRGLDEYLVFPRELQITYKEAGEINAWYDPNAHSVTMSYDLTAYLAKLYIQGGRAPVQAVNMAADATVFIMMHELGHAVIGELDLPTTGKEEDAADEFAILQSARLAPKRFIPTAEAAAEWFRIMGGGKIDISQFQFWDEHSLDQQRGIRIMASLYAGEPTSYRFLEGRIPRTRLQQAQLRFPTKEGMWDRLIEPWLEHGADGVRGALIAAPGAWPTDKGHFRIRTGKISDPKSKAFERGFNAQPTHPFAEIENAFDKVFLFPNDLTLEFADTDGTRSAYNHRSHLITISMPFLWEQHALFVRAHGEQQGGQLFGKFVVFWVIQELGHAMIQELQIPYTGQLEDAAAEFAMLFYLIHPAARGELKGALAWYEALSAEQTDVSDLKFWSAAALDQQRFYDLLCYLHAADPKANAWVAELVPESRLRRAAHEFPRKMRNWNRLIGVWSPLD